MKSKLFLPLLLSVLIILSGCAGINENDKSTFSSEIIHQAQLIELDSIPTFEGKPYVVVNDNIPNFKKSDSATESFEIYADLDHLGRCGVAYANIGRDIMPTEERGAIGSVKPSGWQTAKYDIVDGKYLYNRCHLIGYQLTGENANKSNLITGTRYLNVEGMLPFENMVADYIKESENHVLYRVTPIFTGENLVADGIQIEAKSVEDSGEGICFNVYCYNVQPGISIDYATGINSLSQQTQSQTSNIAINQDYVLNTNTKRFHYPGCSSLKQIKQKYKQDFNGNRDDLINQGYIPCGNCKP